MIAGLRSFPEMGRTQATFIFEGPDILKIEERPKQGANVW